MSYIRLKKWGLDKASMVLVSNVKIVGIPVDFRFEFEGTMGMVTNMLGIHSLR